MSAVERSDADVLEAAADALFVHGRVKGWLGDETQGFCPVGAIAHVRGRDPYEMRQVEEAYADPLVVELDGSLHLPVRPLGAGMTAGVRVGQWNDRTDDDAVVIDALRRCAKHLRTEDES